jgi:hypothetical protein
MHGIKKGALAFVASILMLLGLAFSGTPAQAFVPIEKPSATPANTSHKPSHLIQSSKSARLSPEYYFYGGAQQNAISPAIKSMTAAVTIDDPWMSSCCAYHTLEEMTLQTTINPLDDVIEWGWTRDNTGLYADTKPRLFTSIFVDGVWQGYGTHFVDYSGNSINNGQDLTPYLNTEKVFGIQYAAATGPSNPARWWLYFDGSPVGSYAASDIPGLNSGATAIQVFGEVDGTDDHPCTDMGGNPASLPTSTTYTARYSSVTYDTGTPNLVAYAPTPLKYGGVLKSGSTRTVNLGGPSEC